MTFAKRRARRRDAGFTLVELMVGLTGGLIISLAVFALARDSGRFYQREARLANATVAGLVGFERLRTDISRAGFLSSANIVRDLRQCVKPVASWPYNIRNMASVQVSAPGVTYPMLTANGRTPPSLLLAGAFTSSEVFRATGKIVGLNTEFHLDVSPPIQSALMRAGGGALPDSATMQAAFPALRGLRIVQNGRQYYGQITSAVGGADPTVTINASPALYIKGEGGGPPDCGLEFPGSGAGAITINVVNFVQYQLGRPQTPTGILSFAGVFTSAEAGPGEAGRTELMRVEQAADGSLIDGTEELVAEYAVDFGLSLTAVTGITGCCNPTVGTIVPSAAQFATFTGPVFGSGNTPELIRSVRVRLSVRSRESDRSSPIANPTGDALYRFNVTGSDAGTTEDYARVRTSQADVALHNQLDVLW